MDKLTPQITFRTTDDLFTEASARAKEMNLHQDMSEFHRITYQLGLAVLADPGLMSKIIVNSNIGFKAKS